MNNFCIPEVTSPLNKLQSSCRMGTISLVTGILWCNVHSEYVHSVVSCSHGTVATSCTEKRWSFCNCMLTSAMPYLQQTCFTSLYCLLYPKEILFVPICGNQGQKANNKLISWNSALAYSCITSLWLPLYHVVEQKRFYERDTENRSQGTPLLPPPRLY